LSSSRSGGWCTGTSGASPSELRESLAGHLRNRAGERIVQTPASVRCADCVEPLVLIGLSPPYRLLPFPAPLLRPWFPTGRGSSTARAGRSKSSIATACFAAGSSGCERRAIWLGG